MSGPTTRRRDITVLTTKTESGTRNAPPFQGFDTTLKSSGVLFTTQETVSEGHPFGALSKTDADLGGGFFSSRSHHWHNSPWIEVKSSSGFPYSYFKGRIFPKIDHSELVSVDSIGGSITHSDDSVLNAAGTTAIARTIPTNPVAGLSVTLGELHEGFPRLIGTLLFKQGLKKILKGSGDELLNYEFGIKPLINDLLGWGRAWSHADKLWNQFLRDSGRRVRRRYTFPKSTEVLDESVANAPVFGAGITGNPNLWQGGTNSFPLYTSIVLERERWFSGCFTYFVEADSAQRKAWYDMGRRLQYLYGLKITPEVIWNLAPWSWAADWIANMGSLATNFSRFSEDGLVMPYGYMMERSSRKATYRMRNVTPKGYVIPDLTQVLTQTVKYRIQATPYGFGLSEQTFTARQWAIIGALGLSRT